MMDTNAAEENRYYELLRQQSPMDRLATAVRLTRAVRQLAVADIVRVDPTPSEQQVRSRLADRLYGPEVSSRYFPE